MHDLVRYTAGIDRLVRMSAAVQVFLRDRLGQSSQHIDFSFIGIEFSCRRNVMLRNSAIFALLARHRFASVRPTYRPPSNLFERDRFKRACSIKQVF